MNFKIGTRTYRVKMVRELSCDGENCDGLCSHSHRTIWLDAARNDKVIVDVLRHEHVHAWEFETCVPHTQEDRANFSATVGAAFDKEFNAQGGLKGLRCLRVEKRSKNELRWRDFIRELRDAANADAVPTGKMATIYVRYNQLVGNGISFSREFKLLMKAMAKLAAQSITHLSVERVAAKVKK